MFFLHKKHLTQRNLYTQTAHTSFHRPTFLHAELYPEQFLHSRNFFAQKPLRTINICTTVFADRRFLHRKFSAQKSYAQHFLHTDAFTHRCLCTDTNCTQKLVHTARVYTHSQLLHREALLPLLDHLPFVFPLSSLFQGEETFQPGLAVRLRLSGARKSWLWQRCITMMNLRYLGKAAKLLLFILRQLRPC